MAIPKPISTMFHYPPFSFFFLSFHLLLYLLWAGESPVLAFVIGVLSYIKAKKLSMIEKYAVLGTTSQSCSPYPPGQGSPIYWVPFCASYDSGLQWRYFNPPQINCLLSFNTTQTI
jgi:hypothetical protein